MGWVYLLIAGLCELGLTTSMKFAEGFTRLLPTVGVALFGALSGWLISKAMQTIPIGTAYAIWTGIGAFGTAVIGMIFFKDPATFARIFWLIMLAVSLAGLKIASGD